MVDLVALVVRNRRRRVGIPATWSRGHVAVSRSRGVGIAGDVVTRSARGDVVRPWSRGRNASEWSGSVGLLVSRRNGRVRPDCWRRVGMLALDRVASSTSGNCQLIGLGLPDCIEVAGICLRGFKGVSEAEASLRKSKLRCPGWKWPALIMCSCAK